MPRPGRVVEPQLRQLRQERTGAPAANVAARTRHGGEHGVAQRPKQELLLQVVFSVCLFADQREVRSRGFDGVGFPGEPDRWDLDARFELGARLPAAESELLAGIVDYQDRKSV